jgi:mannose-6-phosphate isomerase-like protein (cupin superfamily)
MSGRDLGFDRGWYRFGFETMDFHPMKVHGGTVDVDVALAFDRGAGKPFVAFCVIPPGGETPALGLHTHLDEPSGKEIEEWYLIVDGTGIQRFTNGDSVEFGPGDMIATYSGTGHSLQVTGDRPVKLVAIAPAMFTTGLPPDEWPETWEPRIRVLAESPGKNPLSAECADCGAAWQQPEDDPASNTLSTWAVEHDCTSPAAPVHLAAGERSETPAA